VPVVRAHQSGGAGDPGCGHSPAHRPELEQAIADAQQKVDKLRTAFNRPFPPSLSEHLRFPRPRTTMRANVPAHVLATPGPQDSVRVAIGCCRYGGFPFERGRADEGLQRLEELVSGEAGGVRPELLFMLGDQIYADRTAGLVDELSPSERFFFRHHEAFTTVTARKLFSSLPTVCLPDDHEFVDSYPLGRPLLRRGLDERGKHQRKAQQREQAARDVALRALEAYQLSQLPASARADGYCTIDRGRVRFFVLDTRTRRKRRPNGKVVTTTTAARRAFQRWVRQCAQEDVIACLVTSSVVLPGLHAGADPANMGPVDSMQAAPAERAWLLGELATHLRGRFVLLSGDYHVSFAGSVCVGGEVVGAAIVAPPFYAPLVYANAQPQDLQLGEAVRTRAGLVSVQRLGGLQEPVTGSGFATLDFIPAGSGWQVRLREELVDFERYEGWFSVGWPVVRLPGRPPVVQVSAATPSPAPVATPAPASGGEAAACEAEGAAGELAVD
jgi:hypothetical protein